MDRAHFALLSAAFVLAGCPSSPSTPVDAGRDGASADVRAVDALASDAPTDTASVDVMIDLDGGAAGDAAIDDAGVGDDAAALPDAGETDDAGAPDGGTTMDAGADDAGAADAGSDSGPRADGAITTCSIAVSPSSATTSETVTFTLDSNGTSCQARVDGGAMLAVPCSGSTDVGASVFGVGTHTIELLVGDGPAGPATCSTMLTVTMGTVSGTTCSISVTPESGPASTTFTATWSSDGAGCQVRVDGADLGTAACTGSFSAPGTILSPGMHTATLLVASGPGGPTNCSDTFVVTP